MTAEENIKAILECNFTETKPEIIDNAYNSILHLSIFDRDANPYFEGYSQGYSDGYEEGEKIKQWRTTGEWIDTDEKDEWYGESYRCSLCGHAEIGGGAYCPNCGAKMHISAE